MSLYPITATAQGLYEASTTRKHVLGTIAAFNDTEGVVYARYMSNAVGASLAAGLFVNQGSVPGSFDTDAVGDVGNHINILGCLCASVASTAGSGFAWVAFSGPVTAAQMAATLPLSSVSRALSIDANGRLSSFVSNIGTASATTADTERNVQHRAVAFLSNTTTTVDSGTDSDAKILLFWR